jgi:hypothetical protein
VTDYITLLGRDKQGDRVWQHSDGRVTWTFPSEGKDAASLAFRMKWSVSKNLADYEKDFGAIIKERS